MSNAAKKLARGAFILFEGCDRSGKSTQAVKLCERLASDGVKVEAMRFPERNTEIGKMINAYLTCARNLDDNAIHLLFSANRWELRSRILELLNQGTTIICDRYTFSGVAFSSAKGMDFDWCKSPDVGKDLTLRGCVVASLSESSGSSGCPTASPLTAAALALALVLLHQDSQPLTWSTSWTCPLKTP